MAIIYDANGNPLLSNVVGSSAALGALNAEVNLLLNGQAAVIVKVSAIGSQTLIFEASGDGTNWDQVNGYVPSTGVRVQSTTVAGVWVVDVAGFTRFRVRCSAYTSGSAVLTCTATTSPSATVVAAATVAQGSVTANQPGVLIQGAVTTAAPAYTTAQTDPLSLTTTGHLRAGIAGNIGGILDAIHNAAAPANVLAAGAGAASANPAVYTAGNLVRLLADLAGRLAITPFNPRLLNKFQATTISAAAETTIITAGAASTFRDLVGLLITTQGAAAQTITIRDVTAGGTPWIIDYPNAALAPGTPFFVEFASALSQGTAASAWTATPGAATAIHVLAWFTERLG
jgi:hypothetical protein